jgi:hypothetical protein
VDLLLTYRSVSTDHTKPVNPCQSPEPNFLYNSLGIFALTNPLGDEEKHYISSFP